MQRSDALLRFVTVVVFIALLVYIGCSVYKTKSDVLRTVPASKIEVRSGVMTEGFAVREEERLSSPGGNIAVTASEGAKISSGQALAMRYDGQSALMRVEEMRELELQIKQLSEGLAVKDTAEAGRESIHELAKMTAAGKLTNLDAVKLKIEEFVFSDGVSTADSAEIRIAELQGKLDAMNRGTYSGTETVSAEKAGTFSLSVDGLENIGPEDIQNLTPESMDELFSDADTVRSSTFGKLVYGIKWYYVTVVDTGTAARLAEVKNVKIAFSKTYSATLDMKVESTGVVSDGKCVVVFSCSKFIQNVTNVRDMTGEIVFSAQSGLKVPKSAVHLDDDGNTFIYILEGLQARSVPVEILEEKDDCYMASASGELREDDLIITAGAGLRDGAVVTG